MDAVCFPVTELHIIFRIPPETVQEKESVKMQGGTHNQVN